MRPARRQRTRTPLLLTSVRGESQPFSWRRRATIQRVGGDVMGRQGGEGRGGVGEDGGRGVVTQAGSTKVVHQWTPTPPTPPDSWAAKVADPQRTSEQNLHRPHGSKYHADHNRITHVDVVHRHTTVVRDKVAVRDRPSVVVVGGYYNPYWSRPYVARPHWARPYWDRPWCLAAHSSPTSPHIAPPCTTWRPSHPSALLCGALLRYSFAPLRAGMRVAFRGSHRRPARGGPCRRPR